MDEEPNRCRIIVLAAPDQGLEAIKSVAQASDVVAAAILYSNGEEPTHFEAFCKTAVKTLQAVEIATLVADDSRVFGRSGADGIVLDVTHEDLHDQIVNVQARHMAGVKGLDTRHKAMEVGEAKPDFVLFGRLNGKRREHAHPKDMELAEWWASVIEVPCVLVVGSSEASLLECARTGADFVAIDIQTLSQNDDPAQTLSRLDAELEKNAPRFEEEPV